MNLPSYKNLDIQSFQNLFNNMSESYKLFWFQAIIDKVHEGNAIITYDELINNMIADAWYMVAEYKLNLGPADAIERVVKRAFEISNLKSNESRQAIINFISNCNDIEIKSKKQVLTQNVPYRVQAPFMPAFKGDSWKGSQKLVAERINQASNLMYRFGKISGLKSEIIVNPDWVEYIVINYEIIKGWLKYNLITYLQKRNPSVPGISVKLSPPEERKLDKVKKYWKAVIATTPIVDIYSGAVMDIYDVSIDHFIPWSYVAHDELWNLCPTIKAVNSSKNNHLPDWDTYFERLCHIEFTAFETVQKYEQIRYLFTLCAKEHINDPYVLHKLYRNNITKPEFYKGLEEVVLPIYNSAKNMDFGIWKL